MRVLILVLASDTEPIYCKFQSVWKNVSHPRADILFLKAHPNLQGNDFIHENTVYIKCEESLNTVYEKQMRCFRLLRSRLNDYAYVFRTNLSSFVDIPKYLHFCETLPRSSVYSGVIGHHNGIPFASGCGFTLTPDLIYRLLDENPPEVLIDDVSIGYAIAKWNVVIVPAPRVDILATGIVRHVSDVSNIVFHYRIKTHDRVDDVRTLASLFKNGQPVVVDKPLSKSPFWMLT